jgi:hypothetical protein
VNTALRVFLGKDELIEMLNRKQPNLEQHEKLVLRYAERSCGVPPEEAQSLWLTEVSYWLRYRVDEWLGSGLNPDGSESPLNKDLFRTEHAKWAVLSYLEKHPVTISPSPASRDWYMIVGEPHRLSDNWNDCFIESVTEADRYFTSLMLSDWKESVCQCRFNRCSRYFLLNRPRRGYRYGTFCSQKHQSQASAAACTLLQSVQARNELIEFAAAQLATWSVDGPEWRNDDSWKRRLSAELRLFIAQEQLHNYRQEVGVNWVNRHSAAIEERRAQLRARQTRATGTDEQAPLSRLPKTRLKWVPRQTPDLRHFIRVLSIE